MGFLSLGRFEMIFIFLTKVLAFYMQVYIIKIGILGLDKYIRVFMKICLRLVTSLFNAGVDNLSKLYIGRK